MKSIIRVSLLLLSLSLGLLANAQLNYYSNNYYYGQNKPKVSVGVKAGINISDFKDFSEESGMKIGFNAGITIDYSLNRNLYLSSGLEFFNRKMRHDYADSHSSAAPIRIPDGVIKAMYIQIPLHLGYRFEMSRDFSLSVHGGPYVAYGVGGRVEMGDWVYYGNNDNPVHLNDFSITHPGFKRVLYTFENKEKGRHGKGFHRFDWGLGLGILLEYQRVGLGLNYDFGLQDVSRQANVKVRTGYLTLGYKF